MDRWLEFESIGLGGSDKGVALEDLCNVIADTAHAAVLIGDVAEQLEGILRRLCEAKALHTEMTRRAEDFTAAFSSAVDLAPQGAIVLLSPGFASFGWFRDYRDRGRQFSELARKWVADGNI